MFSIPPTTTISLSPVFILCAPIMMAFIPEEQTLFTVVQGTSFGIPAASAACRAGACPKFACSTLPIMTSSTVEGFKPILSRAPRIAAAPN